MLRRGYISFTLTAASHGCLDPGIRCQKAWKGPECFERTRRPSHDHYGATNGLTRERAVNTFLDFCLLSFFVRFFLAF